MLHKRFFLEAGFIFFLALVLAVPVSSPAGTIGSSGTPTPVPTPALCATTPYPTTYQTPNPITQSPQVWSFQSEPQLHPMKVQVNKYDYRTYSGLIFLGPYAFSAYAEYGQAGSLILDNSGNPVWFRPLSSPNLMNTDFRVQQFNGRPVLTFWQGTLATPPAYSNIPGGSSEPGSCYYILDNTYRVIATVVAQKGYIPDIHEFLLTPRNTALLLSTRAVPMDLTRYGGPKNGYVQDFAIQEIDPRTNDLLFFWNALNHIPLSDSYEPASSATSSGNVWDAYHLISIGLTDNANDILVSARNTFTIYRISKPTGTILWRLGGKHSDFQIIGAEAQFSWQHDARFHLGASNQAGNVISMFDDNCCESQTVPPGTPASHGLFLQVNSLNRTASLQRQFYLDSNLHVASQGSVQTLPNSNIFVGWGQSAYYSEFGPLGNTVNNPSLNLLYYAQMPGKNYSYRAYHDNWVGTPYYPPRIAAISSKGQTTVYASWNGATETRAWQVFSGASPGSLSLAKTAAKSGFETAVPVTGAGRYFQVRALDARGRVIGISSVVMASSQEPRSLGSGLN